MRSTSPPFTPVQSLASVNKTGQAKKPQAECLDRWEVTKDQSGLGSGFSFITGSKLWLCQKEMNEGSEGTVCLSPFNSLHSLRLSLFFALRPGSATQ